MMTGTDTAIPQYKSLKKTVANTPNLSKLHTVGKAFIDSGYATIAITEGGFLSYKHGFGTSDNYSSWHESWSHDAGKLLEPGFPKHIKKEFRFLHDGFLEQYYRDIPEVAEYIKRVQISEGTIFYDLPYKRSFLSGSLLKKLEKQYWIRVNMMGEMMRWIESLEDVLVIVTSSRGYAFADSHDAFGNYMQPPIPENTHVPLLIKWPGLAYRKISQLTTEVDIATTLYDILGYDPKTSGISLLDAIKGKKTTPRQFLKHSYQTPHGWWRTEITPNSYISFPK